MARGGLSSFRRQRLREVKKSLADQPAEAFLISNLLHVRYLSGFTGSEALALVTRRGAWLFVDSRYLVQAENETSGFKVVLYDRSLEFISRFLSRQRIKTLAFEAEAVSHARFLEMRRAFKGVKLKKAGPLLQDLRVVKDPEEVRRIKRAARIAARAFSEVLSDAEPGMKERDFALRLETRMRELGSEAAPFPTIVASGPRGALPHGTASRRKMKARELVTVDFGSVWQGYNSDQTVTFCLGRPTRRQQLVYDTVLKAHDRALAGIRAGVKAKEVDRLARECIEEQGFGKFFGHGLGHGVGLEVHEPPALNPKSDAVLEEGMVVTVEPGVYIPGWGGVRIEDMALVTAAGCKLLTNSGGPLRKI